MYKRILITLAPITMLCATTVHANDVFNKNCAGCHAGGKNVMNPAKTLSSGDLEKNGVNSLNAITSLITNGKPPMPGFKGVLDDAAIDEVAAYVLEQSKKGW